VRLVDVMFRGGHLSENALVEAVMNGQRPPHFERCDICAERAVELGRWLDSVRTTGIEAGDAMFPAERLTAQQAQIFRRLEQLESPARVIAFPGQAKLGRENGIHRVAAGWLGVAAAAGLILGVIGGQVSARMGMRAAQVPPPSTAQSEPAETAANMPNGVSLLDDFDRVGYTSLGPIDDVTPRISDSIKR